MIYHYQCSKCDHQFDRTLPMKDNDLPEQEPCPNCNENDTVNQMVTGAPAIVSGRSFCKPDNGFKEVQAKIAENHPNHKMNMW